MAKIMQNLVVLMEKSASKSDNSLDGGKIYLNRFVIDEDAAFELSGVYYFWSSLFHQEYASRCEGCLIIKLTIYDQPVYVCFNGLHLCKYHTCG